MRNSNFALRLQASLLEEARELAKAEGVALNQLINVAVAEKLASHRTAAFLSRFTQGADVPAAMALLVRPRAGEPARSGDELPEGWSVEQFEQAIEHKRRGGRRKHAAQPGKPGGRARRPE